MCLAVLYKKVNTLFGYLWFANGEASGKLLWILPVIFLFLYIMGRLSQSNLTAWKAISWEEEEREFEIPHCLNCHQTCFLFDIFNTLRMRIATGNIYRVSQKKTGISVQMPITGLGRGLKIKVGWVSKNSGNFQSNEHRNFVFLSKNDWDIKAQSWLPSP